MNAIWTSSITKINPNKETFESDIEELLTANGFHLKAHKNQNIFENSSEDISASTNQNHLENEIEEVHLQMRSRSVSRLRGENISENTTVLKVYSKTILNENELTSKLSNTDTNAQKEATLCEGIEVPEECSKMKDKLRNKEEKCVSDDKMKNVPVREARMHNRTIEDPEVIEIYFSKKDVDLDKKLCMRTSAKEDDASISGTNAKTTIHNVKHTKPVSLNENRFVEPTRDRQNSVDCKFEKSPRDLKKIKNEVNDSETSGVFKGKMDGIELDMKENSCNKWCTQNDSSVTGEVSLKDLSDKKNVRSNERKCTTENTALNLANDLRCLKNENFENSPKNLAENCSNSQKCDGGNMNFSIFEDTLLTRAKENQNICLNSTFIKTVCKTEETDVKSNESELSKSSLISEGSEDLSSVENITIIPKEEKSSVNSLKENKIKVVIEKRENKEENFERDVCDDVKSNLSTKNVSSMIHDKKQIQDSQHEIAKTEVTDCKDEITPKMKQISYCERMDICQMLTSIHEQLTYDLKRIKDIEAKLQGKFSASSNNYTMPLQLLDKTVARCKSYIHGSNNSPKTQCEIAKILSTYGEQLMVAVHNNTVALNGQELQMQFHGQNLNDKRNILKEINSSWNYWQPEIVHLIGTISLLVKHVMDKNEEKENVKDPRKYKTVPRHTTNNFIVHDLKSKHKNDRVKFAKLNLFKKESAVETQISVASNLHQTKSKNSVKLFNVVNREKEKIQNDLRINEKKTTDKSKTKKESTKNKNHGSANQQPVWRPGGIVKIPSSNSATTLQKIRSNVKEKTNLFSEHTKAEKPAKAVSASKKKISDDFSSLKNILSSMRTTLTTNSHNSKIVGKRSNTSMKTSPRMKPRPGTIRATPRNEPVRQVIKHPNSKFSENRTHDDVQKRSKESKTLSSLKETNGKEVKNITSRQFYDKINQATFDPRSEAILTKEETCNSKEEPTRDDSSRLVENLPKFNDTLHENRQVTETIPEALDLSKKRKNTIDGEIGIDKHRSKASSDYSVNTNHVTRVRSKYECTGFDVSNRQTLLNSVSSPSTQKTEQKNEKRELDEETLKKGRTNSHALSLSRLKEFLCEQGIDADLVNRAERELKDKQRTGRYSKKKSISFADMFFSVRDDQKLQKVLKNEHLWDMLEGKEENDINHGNNLGKIDHKSDGIDSEKSLKYAENGNCETDLKHMENAIDSEKNLKYVECHENGIKCVESLKHMEYHKENDISCENSIKCTECHKKTDTDCEKCLMYAECHEENDISCEKSLKYTERQKENIECKKNLKYIECHKENDIDCKKSLKYTERHKENDICEKSLKQDGIDCEQSLKHKKSCITNVVDSEANLECAENVVNHERNLKHTKNYKGNDCESYSTLEEIKRGEIMDYENNLKYIERHEEIAIGCEGRLKHVENVINCERDDSEVNKENHINFLEKNSRGTRIYDDDINCEKSLRYIGTYEENDVKKNSKSAEVYENNVIDCEAGLKNVALFQKEYNSNYDSLRFPRKHVKIDITPGKNLDSHCKHGFKHTENYRENSTCGNNTKQVENHKENSNNYGNSTTHIENHGEGIHYERDLQRTKNQKESKNNCESRLKNIENYKENCINCQRNVKPTKRQTESSINYDSRVSHIEKDNYFEERLQHTENCSNNNNNCDSSKYPENHREIDIAGEQNLRHTEYHKESNIIYDSSLNHVGNRKGNGINCDCNLNYAKNYKGSNTNYDSNVEYVANRKENNVNCDSDNSVKYVGNQKENNINSDGSSDFGESYNEGNINCDSSLKYAKDCKESNINCDRDLRFVENNKVDNINYDNSLEYAENHEENNVKCDNALNKSEYHKHNSDCEDSLKYTKKQREIDINRENTLKYVKSHKGNLVKNSSNVENYKEDNCCNKSLINKEYSIDCNKMNPPAEGEIVNHERNLIGSPQPEMRDAASCTEKSNKDVYSQTNFQIKDSKTLEIVLQNNTSSKELRVTETQTEIYCMRNTSSKGINVSSMTVAHPINNNSMETIIVSSLSTSMADQVDRKNFRKKNLRKESYKSSKSIETTFDDSENSSKKCDNFFRQLLNQIQESNCEKNDALNELSFVESNASTSTSASSPERETVMKHAHTSATKVISSETMAAFHVTAIRIRNIYKAVDIYKRKLRNDLKAEKRSKRVNKICKEKPSCVSKSSSVDSIFARKNGSDQNGVVQIFEALRQEDDESSDVCENEEEDYESTKSSSTMWSYESTCGKVELKISGKLSDTVLLKDVGHLMDFLVQKTDDSMGKTDSVHTISSNSCRFQNRFQDNETSRFSIFSRENLLPLVYGIVCSIVFWCLHFTITCDVVL
ncbi:uncharacterized protein LOC105663713 [Megachile rotundata]|uniref:uncharacterized protein LOC105663713 n=1 Tax=Megachile rotundata TaxID=143995 RepID=UPI003FD36E45